MIEIRTDDLPDGITYSLNVLGNEISDIGWVTKCPAPSALGVCGECRTEALKFWTLRFEPCTSRGDSSGRVGGGGGGPIIYINPRRDTIYANLKWNRLCPILFNDIRAFDATGRGVRSLALAAMFFWAICTRRLFRRRILSAEFERVTLVLGQALERDCSDWDDDGSCALVPPVRDLDIRLAAKMARKVREILDDDEKMGAEEHARCFLRVAVIRRGEEAKALYNGYYEQ